MSAIALGLIGWIGNGLLVMCSWRLAYKERGALLYGVAGSAVWAVKALFTYQMDLLFIEVVLGGLQLFAYIKWGKKT